MPLFVLTSTCAAANTANFDFNLNVAEVITVTVKDPANWASGGTDTLLRNKVNVEATTNSPIGITVSMYTGANTELRNTSNFSASDASTYIPTLASSTTASAFPANYWGYSVNDTAAGNNSANYDALKTSADPIRLFTTVGTSNVGGSSKDVFFAAKADGTKQSGTYAQTVYFAAVSGTIDTDNPAVPVNPSNPDDISDVAHYSPTTGRTTYTTRGTSGSGTSSVSGATNDTTTQIATGDLTSYYADAYGVTNSTEPASNTVTTDTTLPTALGVTAGVATVSGLGLFAAHKRKLNSRST